MSLWHSLYDAGGKNQRLPAGHMAAIYNAEEYVRATKEFFERLFLQAGFSEVQLHTKDGEDWICVAGRR